MVKATCYIMMSVSDTIWLCVGVTGLEKSAVVSHNDVSVPDQSKQAHLSGLKDGIFDVKAALCLNCRLMT